MQLALTPEEAAFRAEVRAFLETALPTEVREALRCGRRVGKEQLVAWQRTLNARGWAVPHWPVEWGGTGWTTVQEYLWLDALQQAPAPSPLAFNVDMVGPVIAAFGSEAQKQRYLPRAANLDDWWCQGFSEPGAGSDLAALKTSARRDGDDYVVNGHKIWTTYAQYADWIFCLVRTDPQAKKQQGISFLLIDMRSPGITVRPIITIGGEHEINEVLFADVRVPRANLVGEENRGWDYAKYLLGRERAGIARVGASKERLRWLKSEAGRAGPDGRALLDDPAFRERLAAIEIELKALEITQLRALTAAHAPGDARPRPNPTASILKVKGTEIQQAITELLLEVAGPYAMPWRAEPADWNGAVAPTYFNWRKLSIFGGSNEIQRNIIAKAILGL